MLEEKISKHLGKPYIYIPDQKKFLCSNGVLFTLEEYKNGIDINAEYERREKEDKLYDYAYAKSRMTWMLPWSLLVWLMSM